MAKHYSLLSWDPTKSDDTTIVLPNAIFLIRMISSLAELENPELFVLPSATSDIEELLSTQAKARINDDANVENRRQINGIFEVSSQLQKGIHTTSVIRHYNALTVDPLSKIPSLNAISLLAIQLNKLEILNLNIRVNSLNRTIHHLEKKNERIRDNIAGDKNVLELQKSTVTKQHQELLENYKRMAKQLDDGIEEYRIKRINHIEKQSIRIQLKDFEILKEAIFSRSKDNNLLFYHQPILKISTFLTQSIISINQFLENLINLQYLLTRLFKIELPYLAELLGFLPDAEFFNLVKEKNMRMLGKTEDDEDDEEIINHINNQDLVSPSPPTSVGRIIKLGDAIKLPLSSKTLNNQRRASLITASSSRGSLGSPSRGYEKLTQSTTPRPPVLVPESNPNRRIVIIPHKILNKPFSKLSIKEFLKFILVIVKIIANFQVMFMLTIGTEYAETDEFMLEFENILGRVTTLDQLFISKLAPSKVESNLISSSIETIQELFAEPIDKLNLHALMTNVYKNIVKGNDSSMRIPTILQDLNLSDLIANQTKLHFKDEWDVISQIE